MQMPTLFFLIIHNQSHGHKFPAVDRYTAILYLYRHSPINIQKIQDELPESSVIFRELEK